MATKLLKEVHRECLSTFAIGKGARESIVIVTLEPGDLLTFRIKGGRERFSVSLHGCFNLAMMMTMDKKYNEKLSRYKELKKAGAKKLKTPRKPLLPYSKIYFKALNS